MPELVVVGRRLHPPRLLARALFGAPPAAPASYAATAMIELTVTLLARALLAYRGTRGDPMVALREQG